MKFTKSVLAAALMTASVFSVSAAVNAAYAADVQDKVIVAHRGASAYLPEHTLESKALAYTMGVKYIEQDLAMTKDDRLVVVHNHFLDRVTDVARSSQIVLVKMVATT